MSKYNGFALLLLRIAFGGIIAVHGANHLAHFSDFAGHIGVPMAIGAVLGELAGGLGLAVGLLTRVAGAGMGIVMMSVALTQHLAFAKDIGTGKGPTFEYPFLLGILGLSFIVLGGGPYSLDALIGKARKKAS